MSSPRVAAAVSHPLVQLFDTYPERPHPLTYVATTVPLSVAPAMVGWALVGDRPHANPLAAASLAGGLIIGATGGAIESVLPSGGPVVGPLRCALVATAACCGGAAVGTILSARIGCELLPPEAAVEASLMGTSVLVLAGIGLGMLAVFVGVLRGDPRLADPSDHLDDRP